MFTQRQRSRLTKEYDAVSQFLDYQNRINLMEIRGVPPSFYRISYKDVVTTVVEKKEYLNSAHPALRITPVSFELIMNIPLAYPRSKPTVFLSPAYLGGNNSSAGMAYLYNSHILLFGICLFSTWCAGRNSLVDVIQRTWDVVTYNHRIINLDRGDCINPKALEWYKRNVGKISFPLDSPLQIKFVGERKTEDLFQFSGAKEEK